MNKICKFAIEDIKDKDGVYNEAKLVESCNNIIRPGMTEEEILSSIMPREQRGLPWPVY